MAVPTISSSALHLCAFLACGPPEIASAPRADPSFANVRDYGAVGDAFHDDTAAFAKAAATGRKLYVPKPPVAYRLTGSVALRNSISGDGSMPEIRMAGSDGDQAHAILKVSGWNGPEPLVIQGLTLNGEWNGEEPPGEWAANIDVVASTNVVIQDNVLLNPAGDNVEIGDSLQGPVRDITVRRNDMHNPLRCNVSLEWADGAVIDDNRFEKRNAYVTSVDVEPNAHTDQYVSNLSITNNVFQAIHTRSVALVNGSGITGDNIRVIGNSGHVGSGFDQTGSWTNVVVLDNRWEK